MELQRGIGKLRLRVVNGKLYTKGFFFGAATTSSGIPQQILIDMDDNAGPSYGTGTIEISFSKSKTSFKIDRSAGEGKPRSVFAVYRSDGSFPIGSGNGTVEISRGQKQNFVLVLTILVLLMNENPTTKKHKRRSMPEVKTQIEEPKQSEKKKKKIQFNYGN